MRKWKRFAPALLFGVFGVMPLLNNERWAHYRIVDMLPLIGSGMFFGVALTSLFSALSKSET